MAYTINNDFANDSNASIDLLTDANALTYAAIAVGAVTVGGGAFVATAVAPSHVIGGTLATGTLFAGSECKKRTGSYLPFLGKVKDEPVIHEIMATEPVS